MRGLEEEFRNLLNHCGNPFLRIQWEIEHFSFFFFNDNDTTRFFVFNGRCSKGFCVGSGLDVR